ncbi:aldo/keto reductase [Candidatus Auribacterota bacterium]
MRKKPLGKSDIETSVIMLGTWAVGGWMWGGTNENEAINAISTAIENGINGIDTAPMYGYGYAEEVVGKAIAGKRDKVVIATKCGLVWHTQKGEHFFSADEKAVNMGSGKYKIYRCLSPETIRYEIEKSLSRLNTDYIDLYQTHWQDPTTSIEDTMSELLKLKDEGKIRAIGVCNASPDDMVKYRKTGILDSDQERYNMLDRGPDSSQLQYCTKHKLAFLAYSPLALGLLTGTMDPERKFNGTDMRNKVPRFSQEGRAKISKLLNDLEPFAKKHTITIPQLVIAWTIHQRGCTHALVGARKPQHAIENAKAGDVKLNTEDVTQMNEIIEKHLPGMPSGKWRQRRNIFLHLSS